MQAVMLWYTPHLLRDGDFVRTEMVKAKEQGFELVIAFVRWMHLNLTHDPVVRAVERDVAAAHELGMKYMIDTDPTFWAIDLTEVQPESAQHMMRRGETSAIDGAFSVFVPIPGAAVEQTHEIFDRVLAVFVEDEQGRHRFLDPSKCHLKIETGRSYEGLHGDPSQGTSPRIKGTMYARISGRAPAAGCGRVLVYASFKIFSYADFAHPAFLKASKALLDKYRHIPLDGVGWDEPGRTRGLENSYRGGDGFLSFFRKYKGYDLEANLVYLDDSRDEKRGTKVRNDYYDALAEMNFRAQDDHNKYAKKLFGRDILLGTHQTFTPLSDYAIGYGDYFRNGRILNPAWVDVNMYQEEDTTHFGEMLHVYCLGDSLRKEFGFERAYSNDYFIPFRPDQIGFFLRTKMLFDISLFYVGIGEHSEYLPITTDRHWEEFGASVRELTAFQQFLGGEYRTLTDTAVFYSPVGLYAFPSGNFALPSKQVLAMRYHLVRHFLREGRTFDFVGGISLERAKIAEGRFTIDDRSYARLILPWTASVSKEIRPVLLEMIERGVQVIFVGPPACRVAETGQDVSRKFFGWFGINPFSLQNYIRFGREPYPEPTQGYPFSQRAFPLQGNRAKVIGRSFDGDVATVQGLKAPNLFYDSSLDALNPSTYGLMSDTKPTGIRVHVNNGYFRIFERKGRTNEWLLLVVAGMRNSLSAFVRVGSDSWELSGGSYAAVKISGDKIQFDSLFTDGTAQKRGRRSALEQAIS